MSENKMAGLTIANSNSDYEERKSIHRTFFKKPIKKDNYNLVHDYRTPQDERREILLQYQKQFRDEAFNNARGIIEEEFLSEDEFLFEDEFMDVERYISKLKPFNIKRCEYRVMLSEWMLDVPQDFTEQWIMVPCPVGKRTILVASKGKTKAYGKNRKLISTFSSELPGGNPYSNMRQYAVVDCIWVESKQTFYALDVLAWVNQPVLFCEASFRLFWINTKLSYEIGVLKKQNSVNTYPVMPLPYNNCDCDLSSVLTKFDDLYPLDGFLFFHKNGHYTFGSTPLVTWLKPFMLSEVLGIFLPSPLDKKPDNYIDYKLYICQYTKNKKRREFLQILWNL